MFLEERSLFLERLTRKEVVLWKGRLGIGVLVRVSVVPVPRDQPEAGGLLRCVGEEEAAGKKRKEPSVGGGL